ncbi:MAG TPA: MnhB domain-containing protein [Terriglobales bacterium]|nr:MnhB domain-containing protein [Terriglobales bacterium]
MKRRARVVFFLFAAAAFAGVYLWGLRGLPAVGHYRGPYGDVLNRVATYERHVTDIVTAVNFDYRGFDTLGEEFILFMSVIGGTVLLRRQRLEEKSEGKDEQIDQSPERQAPEASDATRVLTLGLVGPLVVFGLYIVAHGQLTPGGGFQGGVVLATAPLLVYLAGDLKKFKHITSHTLVEVAEAAGAGAYLAIGFAGLILGGTFLRNVAALGTTGMINSGGTIALFNLATGLEVAAGFVLLLYAFLEQTLEIRLRGGK